MFVESSIQYATLVKHHLEWYGCSTFICHTIEKFAEQYTDLKPDIVLVNRYCMNSNNINILYQFKLYHPGIPIIFVFLLSENMFSITQFGKIFSDYVFKEHFMEEIHTRLETVLMFQNNFSQQQYIYQLDKNCLFNYIEKILIINKKTIKLTQIETDILLELCKNLNNITGKEILLEKCWPDNDYLNNTQRYLDKYMVNLRKYLRPNPRLHIETIRGKGYCLLQKADMG